MSKSRIRFGRVGMRLPAVAVALGVLMPALAGAQMSAMPEAVQTRLEEIGPGWGKNIAGNIAITQELYTPLLRAAPHEGVEVTRDVSYGPDPRNKLDIFKPKDASSAGVVVFLHGGAYVAGDRNVNGRSTATCRSTSPATGWWG